VTISKSRFKVYKCKIGKWIEKIEKEKKLNYEE